MKNHLLASAVLLAPLFAIATTPGSNQKAFENCDVTVCMSRSGAIEYNVFGEDVRLFETLTVRNLHRGVIQKKSEAADTRQLSEKAAYYCISTRENSRLGEYSGLQALEWKELAARIPKCGHRAR